MLDPNAEWPMDIYTATFLVWNLTEQSPASPAPLTALERIYRRFALMAAFGLAFVLQIIVPFVLVYGTKAMPLRFTDFPLCAYRILSPLHLWQRVTVLNNVGCCGCSRAWQSSKPFPSPLPLPSPSPSSFNGSNVLTTEIIQPQKIRLQVLAKRPKPMRRLTLFATTATKRDLSLCFCGWAPSQQFS
jgi:hypothetical protein